MVQQQQKWVFYCLSGPKIPRVIWSQVVSEVIQHLKTGPFVHTFTKGLEGFFDLGSEMDKGCWYRGKSWYMSKKHTGEQAIL